MKSVDEQAPLSNVKQPAHREDQCDTVILPCGYHELLDVVHVHMSETMQLHDELCKPILADDRQAAAALRYQQSLTMDVPCEEITLVDCAVAPITQIPEMCVGKSQPEPEKFGHVRMKTQIYFRVPIQHGSKSHSEVTAELRTKTSNQLLDVRVALQAFKKVLASWLFAAAVMLGMSAALAHLSIGSQGAATTLVAAKPDPSTVSSARPDFRSVHGREKHIHHQRYHRTSAKF